MSFRVKLRIKSVKPYQRAVPALPRFPHQIEIDEARLRDLYEKAMKTMTPIGEGPWTRRFMETSSAPLPPGVNYISWNGGVQ